MSPTHLPTEEVESAIRIIADYPGTVWVFHVNHLTTLRAAILAARNAGRAVTTPLHDDRVLTCIQNELSERAQPSRSAVFRPFVPQDPVDTLCASHAASESREHTGRGPDPAAPRNCRVAGSPIGSGVTSVFTEPNANHTKQ